MEHVTNAESVEHKESGPTIEEVYEVINLLKQHKTLDLDIIMHECIMK